MGETAAELLDGLPEYPAWAEVGKEVVAILGNGTEAAGKVSRVLKRDVVIVAPGPEGEELLRVRRSDYDPKRDRFMASSWNGWSRTRHGTVYPEGHPELILGRLTAVAASCRSALRGSMDRAGAPYPPRDAYGREVLDGELELEALASIRSALDALTEAVTAVVEYRTRGR